MGAGVVLRAGIAAGALGRRSARAASRPRREAWRFLRQAWFPRRLAGAGWHGAGLALRHRRGRQRNAGAGCCGVARFESAATVVCGDFRRRVRPAAARPWPPGISHVGAACHPISASSAAAIRMAARNGKKPSPRTLARLIAAGRLAAAGAAGRRQGDAPRGASTIVGSFKAPPRAIGFQARDDAQAFSSAAHKLVAGGEAIAGLLCQALV